RPPFAAGPANGLPGATCGAPGSPGSDTDGRSVRFCNRSPHGSPPNALPTNVTHQGALSPTAGGGWSALRAAGVAPTAPVAPSGGGAAAAGSGPARRAAPAAEI